MGIFSFGSSETASGSLADCYSLAEVPGKKIKKSFGLVYFTEKNLAGNMPKKTIDILMGLKEAAVKVGANAVVNINITSGSYQVQGSAWEVTYIIAYGDAVILEDGC